MPERPLRLECPVCLGVRLATKRIADDSPLEIDHCVRCGGVWFDHGEADELRRLGTPRKLRASVPLLRGHQRMACRGCEARIQRAAAACDGCGHKNVIDCPVCDRPMERETSTGLRLDVCRSCCGAWFDNDQLRAIWSSQLPAATQHANGVGVWDIPYIDLGGADVGGGVELGNAFAAIPDAAGGVFDGAVSLIEAGGDAAGAVFEVIGSILEFLFGLLEGL
ncbi:MAG TPA: zf-TFIIB domain-containing protein [Longimicrobium sp.]|jgi:Zn-finger nucleic acid-binding protein